MINERNSSNFIYSVSNEIGQLFPNLDIGSWSCDYILEEKNLLEQYLELKQNKIIDFRKTNL